MPLPPMNLDTALRRTGNNPTLLRELIEIFLEETPDHFRSLRSAIDAGDFSKIHLFAHSIRGSVSYFGDSDTERAAAAVEKMGKASQADGLEPAYAHLSETLGRLLQAVSEATLPPTPDKK